MFETFFRNIFVTLIWIGPSKKKLNPYLPDKIHPYLLKMLYIRVTITFVNKNNRMNLERFKSEYSDQNRIWIRPFGYIHTNIHTCILHTYMHTYGRTDEQSGLQKQLCCVTIKEPATKLCFSYPFLR